MVLNAGSSARFAQLLTDQQDQLLKRWATLSLRGGRGRATEAELVAQITDLHAALLSALRADAETDLQAEEAAELRATLAELSGTRARRGFTPGETASTILSLKDAVFEGLDGADSTVLSDFVNFSRFVDELALFTFETYVQTREEVIVEQNHQLLELSTPVIKLWDGVLAVPLVGTLDSARSQVVMESLLQALVDTGSAYAILDITGVPAVDTQVAQHILKTVMAARLMGAECIISGIRPQIAQTVVSLGIEFGDIVTKASLADALLHTLRASGSDVVRRTRRAS
ncbi:STAS domain-containing protein [Actinoplanes sp. NPDC049668]|uniref:STAS domain-containing protein n=1 Tax=unclassified Actinoplanes TaxID=2626549 RepID=UPI0033A09115